MFVVAIALTVGPSMRRRRARDGGAVARWHLAERALVLIGLGAVISAGQAVVEPLAGVDSAWGVLQCLGAATLLLLPVVFTPPWWRVVLGLCLLGAYQLLLDRYWLEIVLRSSHNGLVGTPSWAGLLLVASGIGDAYHDSRATGRQTRLVVLVGLVATTGALLLSGGVEVSKTRASATYMLLSSSRLRPSPRSPSAWRATSTGAAWCCRCDQRDRVTTGLMGREFLRSAATTDSLLGTTAARRGALWGDV